MIGKTVSHYKIIEQLGAGGMGVVYKAEDTKLKRTVALKFLPATALGTDDEKARFVTEAQAAASLSHANIATVFEINEDPDSGDTFISMEYVEGETLAAKVTKSPLKIKDSMKIARQIAEGLAAAHEQGVVHRDIKSANIMITPKGVAKIMDFGLAKVTTGASMTKVGTTMGTIGYMSPEQSRGDTVDHRTDIFSLGVILYEMISGQLPFKGEYETAIVYSIMNVDPDPITGLRTGVPIDLEKIVTKLLAKDPDDRYQNIIELPVDLKNVDLKSVGTSDMGSSVIGKSVITHADSSSKQLTVKVNYSLNNILKYAAMAVILIGLTWFLKPEPPIEKKISKVDIILPDDQTIANVFGTRLAISPDGGTLVYCAQIDGINMLVTRKFHDRKVTPLEGTNGGYHPHFSQDGKDIVFYKDFTVKKIPAEGGSVLTIVHDAGMFLSISWGSNDQILYSSQKTDDGKFKIYRVHSSGGESELFVQPDREKGERAVGNPHFLPDGENFLYNQTSINDTHHQRSEEHTSELQSR